MLLLRFKDTLYEDYNQGLEEIFAAMESLKQELQMMREPLGRTADNPGRSCKDIWLCHKNSPSGKLAVSRPG